MSSLPVFAINIPTTQELLWTILVFSQNFVIPVGILARANELHAITLLERLLDPRAVQLLRLQIQRMISYIVKREHEYFMLVALYQSACELRMIQSFIGGSSQVAVDATGALR